jgi:NhaP-type Na+/H+ or K+/H+ antiporter
LLAWTLGMVPSTVLSLRAPGGREAASAEPSGMAVFGLAFLMGLVLGPVLGFVQWLALRRFVRRAALWMPANALAWAFGMTVIFAGVDRATGGGFGPGAALILALTLTCAGAVVGAIHGLALVWLLRPARRPGEGHGVSSPGAPDSAPTPCWLLVGRQSLEARVGCSGTG